MGIDEIDHEMAKLGVGGGGGRGGGVMGVCRQHCYRFSRERYLSV